LVGADAFYRGEIEKQAQKDLGESLDQVRRGTGSATDSGGGDPARWGPNGFTGRWRIGPEAAPIRIVMLTDFQCPDCKRIEAEAMSLVRSRQDVSLSIKHFPMCMDCNKYAGRTLHANACWAARASEAAGALGGNDAFWKMTEWLYANDGKFETQQSLQPIVDEMGLDITEFVTTMGSASVLPGIHSDIDEGKALGLFYTPMVFINGVEMKGIFTHNALTSAVLDLADDNLPALTSVNDNPVLAPMRYIQDWQESRQTQLPPDATARTYGPANAKVRIVMWGDLQAEPCRGADRKIRQIVNELSDVSYTYRHYPFDRDCNPHLDPKTPENEFGCHAARAVEAAGQLGGPVKYWEMHDRLVAQPNLATQPELMMKAVEELGLASAAFEAMFNDEVVTNAIADDANAGRRAGLTQIPWVFVQGKRVPRWDDVDGSPTLRRIVEIALEEAKNVQPAATEPQPQQ
jgi:protein-disulfide isomerase